MIVRILGEGQFRLDDAAFAAANAADERVVAAVEAGDAGAFRTALRDLVDLIVTQGRPVPAQELCGSDAIVPGADTTLEEARSLLADDGLIPG